MAVRIPGILLIPYFGLFGLIYLIKQYYTNKSHTKNTTSQKKKVKVNIPKEQSLGYLTKKLFSMDWAFHSSIHINGIGVALCLEGSLLM